MKTIFILMEKNTVVISGINDNKALCFFVVY